MFDLTIGRVCVLLSTWLVASATFATTYYVNDSTGNNTYNGLAAVWDGTDGPKQTISSAISASSSGDTIEIAAGTYTGSGNKNLDPAGKNITVRGTDGADDTIIDCEDSGRGFYIHSNETSACVIEGLTILDGNVSSASIRKGGGMYIYSADPTIRDCVIDSCRTATNKNGGAIYIEYSESLIEDCVLKNNLTRSGGGIFAKNADDIIIRGCTVMYNNANTHGTTNHGGGIYLQYTDDALVEDCLILGNNTTDYGGGIAVYRTNNCTFRNCVVKDNKAKYGGGVGDYNDNNTPTFENCLFIGNDSTNHGGAVYCKEATLINCTLTNNTAAGSYARAIHEGSGTITLTNCVIWGHSTPYFSGTLTITYSNVEGGYSGTGNINSDPLLTVDGHLKLGSPCINAGTNTGAPTVDTDGETRPHATTVDMGYDEYIDADSDGLPDWWETLYSETTATDDPDSDGLDNVNEYYNGTDPNNSDTDGDTLSDSYEVTEGLDPLRPNVIFVDDANGDDSYDGYAATYDSQTGHGPKKTISAAIAAAPTGDRVYIAAGTYTGSGNKDLDPDGKDIIIRGTAGAATTIIDCEDSGRGFYIDSGETSGLVIEGLTIKNGDVSGSGAGIYVDGADPTIRDCVFDSGKTTSTTNGGGIYLDDSASLIENCTFKNNEVRSGGGIFLRYSDDVVIRNCDVFDNFGTLGTNPNAGGIYVQYSDDVLIENCRITDNTTTRYGGGILVYRSNGVIIRKCVIQGNDAAYGGAISDQNDYGNATVENCVIVENNSTNHGGAFYNKEVTIINCTIADNTAAATYAGAIYEGSGTVTVKNSIIWGNDSPYFSGTPTITYSNVEGGYTGTGNINSDPLFVDAANDDYHITASSPCVDAGTSSGAPTDDIDEEPRPYPLTTGPWDMGYDEYVEYATLDITDVNGTGSGAEDQQTHIKGTAIDLSVISPLSANHPMERFVGTGWTATGSAPATGTATTIPTFNLNANTTVTWTWGSEYELKYSVNGFGSITGSAEGWYGAGDECMLTYVNDPSGSLFILWAGHATGLAPSTESATITFTMDHPRKLEALAYPESAARSGSNTRFKFTLHPGWTMISVPVVPTDSSFSTAFDGLLLTGHRYETTPGVWIETDTIEPMVGYYVYSSELSALELTIEGDPATNSGLIDLPQGWSAVGVGLDIPIPTHANLISIQYWDVNLNQYVEETDTMKAGIGYWMLTTGAISQLYLGDPSIDSDSDSITDSMEQVIFTTNEQLADTDGDGLNDGDEVTTSLTNPKVPDTDGDGLTDYEEANTTSTDASDPDSDDDGLADGWEVSHGLDPNVANTVQSAVDAAEDGDEVILLPGTYRADRLDFDGKDITLRSTNPQDPTIVAQTILEGNKDVGGLIAPVIHLQDGEGRGAQILGLTIRKGTDSGIICEKVSVTIAGNVIENNEGSDGGGIQVLGGSPLIRNNKIKSNTATQNGGGVSVSEFSDLGSGQLLASIDGAFRLYDVLSYPDQDLGGTYTIEDSGQTLALDGNTWKYINIGSYTVTENTVLEFDFYSTTEGELQGIGLDSDAHWPTQLRYYIHGDQDSKIILPGGYSGGWQHYKFAISADLIGTTVASLVLVNDDDSTPQDGNGKFRNIMLHEGGARIEQNLITDNSATADGGGVHVNGIAATIAQVTLADNTAGGNGGGVHGAADSYTVITDTIVWGNQATSGVAVSVQDASLTIDHAVVEGTIYQQGTVVLDSQGVIASDPLFASSNDYHLQSQRGRWTSTGWTTDSQTSPAIDAGSASSDFALEPQPNGSRRNLGVYGNGDEASLSNPTVELDVLPIALTELRIPEGGVASLSVRLTGQPAAQVTVSATITPGTGGSGLQFYDNGQQTANYTFNVDDWDLPQIVRVTATTDSDQVNGTGNLQLSATGLTSENITLTEIDVDLASNAPVLSSHYPENGALVPGADGSLLVTYTYFDPGATFDLSAVKLEDSGSNDITADVHVTATSISWRLDDAASGVYSYVLTLKDLQGNTSITDIEFVVDAEMPVTTPSHESGRYDEAFTVTLTASEPATVYYSTNGHAPFVGSEHTTSATSPISDISIDQTTKLQFFAVDRAGNREATQTVVYDFTTGSLPPTAATARFDAESNAVVIEWEDDIDFPATYGVYRANGTMEHALLASAYAAGIPPPADLKIATVAPPPGDDGPILLHVDQDWRGGQSLTYAITRIANNIEGGASAPTETVEARAQSTALNATVGATRGADWLLSKQQANGGFSTDSNRGYQATCHAVRALALAAPNDGYEHALYYLVGHEGANTRDLAQKILIMDAQGLSTHRDAVRLKSYAKFLLNQSVYEIAGWGLHDFHYELDAFSTALGGLALARSGLTYSEPNYWHDWVQNLANATYQYFWAPDGDPSVIATSAVYGAMDALFAPSWAPQIRDPAWIASDASFLSDLWATAGALVWLGNLPLSDAESAVDFLLSKQEPDGSWKQNLVLTALCTEALVRQGGVR